jgi:hypothetical protein
MKPVHWLIALIAVAAAGWWGLGHPGYETREQRLARIEAQEQAVEAAKPKLYRWRDRNGVLQLTDTPPKGRKYEAVDVDATAARLNSVPMSEPAPDEKAPAK